MRKGFTMIELMVVIGILGILMAVLVGGFGKAPEKAQIAKCQELVKNTETALTALFNEKGAWPQALIANNNQAAGLDAKAAYPLAKGKFMSLSYNADSRMLDKNDRFGVVTPWAADVIKKQGTKATESSRVPMGGTVLDHRLRYALDLEGDGKIDGVNVAGTLDGVKEEVKGTSIRATVAVWCLGPRGKVIKSWTDGQTKDVK